MENVLVTTYGFHNFEVTIIYDDDSHVISTVLHRVYYRYAFYNTINYVRAADEYVAIGYLIPPIYEYFSDFSRQLITLYDSRDYEHESDKGYSERYMIGSHIVNHSS